MGKRSRLYSQLQEREEGLYDSGQDYLGQVPGIIRDSYGRARGELSRYGASSRQRMKDRETRLGGAITSDLAKSGLATTTAGNNLRRGLAADTSRRLAEIDESLGRMYSNLALGEGNALAKSFGALSQFQTNRAQHGLSGQRGYLDYQIQRKYGSYSGDGGAGAIGSILGGAAGSFLGPLGTSMGSKLGEGLASKFLGGGE